MLFAHIAVQSLQVKGHFAKVFRLEIIDLEFKSDKAGKTAVKEKQIDIEILVAYLDLEFFTDETEIRIEQISGIINQYKTLRFDVEGHTDSTGSDKINNKLSQARADAVRSYLIENGFPADMITAKGFGSSTPIGDNKTSKGRQQNRRVEIFSEYAER